MNETIVRVIKRLYDIDANVVLTRPEPQFGDYSTSVAMQLAKQVGKNPREIAQDIADELAGHEDVKSVDIAGPGFINITLNNVALIQQTRQEPLPIRRGRMVVIETNNPNPFKAMHIGHAFNAILGDTIANLLAVSGATVHRVSYHGDVGLHVGKSMYSLLKFAGGDAGKLRQVPTDERNAFMSKMYTEGSNAYKNDSIAKTKIDELARQSFTRDDPLYSEVYDLCKTWSFDAIDSIVGILGNVAIEKRYLESEADAVGVPTVKAHVPDVFKESNGALVFEGSKHGSFDNAFVTSRGLGLYGARDLGLIQLKQQDFHPDESYIVTAEEQRDYFKGVIAAAGLCLPEQSGITVNVSTGTVKLTTGKMSSRDGDVVEIAWLFDQVAEAVRERGGEVDPTYGLVAGALRYQFLKVKIGSDVVFDINQSVSLTGNTGSYLQYAHARARRIIKKSGQNPGRLEAVEAEDRTLIRKLTEYREIVELATRQLEPHHICNYLFELAQDFNRYYEANKVIGSEQEAHRLSLVGTYADTLRAGLMILGIHAPESM